jgi:hypothetical protein
MQRLTRAQVQIQRLAIADRPGAIVLAEHAVDQHGELFSDPHDRLIALDALARTLIRIGRLQPEITDFLGRVDDYIQIVQRDIEILLASQRTCSLNLDPDPDAQRTRTPTETRPAEVVSPSAESQRW